MTYYNEIEPYAVEWLRNLIRAGQLPAGDVDDRSIVDVQPDDLRGYTQCHFFAGIGGWAYAMRLAGWPDDRPVWTGSCPCQPFSAAGKQRGFGDERHLWPAWFRLIRERRPATVFGEQVASAIGHGWLDLVFDDLEDEGYACGAAVLPACSVGAPHLRQRAWFVADLPGRGCGQGSAHASRGDEGIESPGTRSGPSDASGELVAHRGGERREWRAHSGGPVALEAREWREGLRDVEPRGDAGPVAAANVARLEGWRDDAGEYAGGFASRAAGPWRDLEWLACSDGKARPTQPGLFPLAHGVPGRVGRLRAYGNAIVPQVAEEFVMAFMDCLPSICADGRA